jgi:hypothetical protein
MHYAKINQNILYRKQRQRMQPIIHISCHLQNALKLFFFNLGHRICLRHLRFSGDRTQHGFANSRHTLYRDAQRTGRLLRRTSHRLLNWSSRRCVGRFRARIITRVRRNGQCPGELLARFGYWWILPAGPRRNRRISRVLSGLVTISEQINTPFFVIFLFKETKSVQRVTRFSTVA